MPTQADAFAGWSASLLLQIGLISVQRLVNDGAFVVDTGEAQIIVLVVVVVLRRRYLAPVYQLGHVFAAVDRLGQDLGDLRVVAAALGRVRLVGRVDGEVRFAALGHLVHRVLNVLI